MYPMRIVSRYIFSVKLWFCVLVAVCVFRWSSDSYNQLRFNEANAVTSLNVSSTSNLNNGRNKIFMISNFFERTAICRDIVESGTRFLFEQYERFLNFIKITPVNAIIDTRIFIDFSWNVTLLPRIDIDKCFVIEIIETAVIGTAKVSFNVIDLD